MEQIKPIIIVLDKIREFPNLENFIQEKLSKQFTVHRISHENIDSIKELSKKYYEETSGSVIVFSTDPDRVNKILNTVTNIRSYFLTLEKEDFKSFYEDIKKSKESLFLPKVLISSSKETDLLEVSNIFNKSEISCIKWINGLSDPVLLEFEGVETFNKILTFKSGHLVPATKYDKEELYEGTSLPENKTYILQKFESDIEFLHPEIKDNGDKSPLVSISYSVKSTDKFNLVWTEVTSELVPKNLSNEIEEYLNNTSNSYPNFYMEIESHGGEFFINKIIQGIHPLIKI